jgi:HK97 family phage prohead protease
MSKRFITASVRAMKAGRVITFVGSTEQVARDQMIVRVAGWVTKEYEKNPVFLWAHDYSKPPIGRCLSITVDHDAKALLFDIEFAEREVSEFADEIFRLFKAKMLNAVSVGFIVKKMEEPTEDERARGANAVAVECELLELSAVPVPADTDALMVGKAARAVHDGLVRRDTISVIEGFRAVRSAALDLQALRTWRLVRAALLDEVESQMSKRMELTQTNLGFEYELRAASLFDPATFNEVDFQAEPKVTVVMGMPVEGADAPPDDTAPPAASVAGRAAPRAEPPAAATALAHKVIFPSAAWPDQAAAQAFLDENMDALLEFSGTPAVAPATGAPPAAAAAAPPVPAATAAPQRQENLLADADALDETADTLVDIADALRTIAADVRADETAEGEGQEAPPDEAPEPVPPGLEKSAETPVRMLARIVDRLTNRQAAGIPPVVARLVTLEAAVRAIKPPVAPAPARVAPIVPTKPVAPPRRTLADELKEAALGPQT